MSDRTTIRRGINAILRMLGSFTSAQPPVRHNAVLAKWEQHYDAHPNAFTHQKRYSALRYLTPAD